MKKATFGLISALSLAAVLTLSGCATTKEVEALRSDVQRASETAASAKTTARPRTANNLLVQVPIRAAAEATDAKIDNMFKKSMQKSGM